MRVPLTMMKMKLVLNVSLAAILAVGVFKFVPPLHAESLEDEELRSTIPTDPDLRGSAGPSSKKKKEVVVDSKKGEIKKPKKAPKQAITPAITPETLPKSSSKAGKAGSPAISDAKNFKIDTKTKKIMTGKISFAPDTDILTPESVNLVKKIASFLQKNTEVTIRIEAHTDSLGSDQKNMDLSQRRADRVKENLVAQGVAVQRLEAIGMGDRYLIASDATPTGQEKNRRLDLVVTSSAVSEVSAPQAQTMPAAPVPVALPMAAAPESSPTASVTTIPAQPRAASLPPLPESAPADFFKTSPMTQPSIRPPVTPETVHMP